MWTGERCVLCCPGIFRNRRCRRKAPTSYLAIPRSCAEQGHAVKGDSKRQIEGIWPILAPSALSLRYTLEVWCDPKMHHTFDCTRFSSTVRSRGTCWPGKAITAAFVAGMAMRRCCTAQPAAQGLTAVPRRVQVARKGIRERYLGGVQCPFHML